MIAYVVYLSTFCFAVSPRKPVRFLCSIHYVIKQQKSSHKTSIYETPERATKAKQEKYTEMPSTEITP